MIWLAALSLAVWTYLWTLHGRFWSAGPVLADARPALTPKIAIVVPARDEAATIGPALRSLLAQTYAGPFSVIMVDDRSTDATAAIARSIRDDRLTVLTGAARPEGWSGKLWAVHQGVAAAFPPPLEGGAGRGVTTRRQEGAAGFGANLTGAVTAPSKGWGKEEWLTSGTAHNLLFLTDADIIHAPDHLSSLVAKLTADHLDLVSEMVALNCESPAERGLVPAFVFFFQLLYPFAAVNDPARRAAAAAGGTMLVRQSALARIGGISALRGALIDDVTLARRIKRSGGAIWLGHSARAWSRRPYPGAADVWRMVARTAFVQLRFSWLLLFGCTAAMALVWLVPPALAVFGSGWSRVLGVLAWAAAAASYLPTLRRFGLNPARALLLPLVALFYMAATLDSAIDHVRGRGVRWKDRTYQDGGYTGRAAAETVR